MDESQKNNNFQKCLVYVQGTFPEEDFFVQYKQALAVQAISEVFFTEIIPKIIRSEKGFSDN